MIAKELGENFTDNDIEEMIEEADRDSKQKHIIILRFIYNRSLKFMFLP